MEVERESITRNNIEQYLGFIRNYDKEREEQEKDDMDQRLVKFDTKREHKTFQMFAIVYIKKT